MKSLAYDGMKVPNAPAFLARTTLLSEGNVVPLQPEGKSASDIPSVQNEVAPLPNELTAGMLCGGWWWW